MTPTTQNIPAGKLTRSQQLEHVQQRRLEHIRLRKAAAQRRLIIFGVELLAIIVVAVLSVLSLIAAWSVAIPTVLMVATLALGRKAAIDGQRNDARALEIIEELQSQRFSATTAQAPKVVWRASGAASNKTEEKTENEVESSFTMPKVPFADEIASDDRVTDNVADGIGEDESVAVQEQGEETPTTASTLTPAQQKWIAIHQGNLSSRDADAAPMTAGDLKRAEAALASISDTDDDTDSRGRLSASSRSWEPQALPQPLYNMKPKLGRRTSDNLVEGAATSQFSQVPAVPFRPTVVADVEKDDVVDTADDRLFARVDSILDRRRAANQ